MIKSHKYTFHGRKKCHELHNEILKKGEMLLEMNKTQIEMRAIIALEDILTRSQYIIPEIAKNDKTPSWDGIVFVYDQPGTKKKDLLGKIDIQVKGHYNANDFSEKITYSVEVSDLRNYLIDSGVIYFVIYLKDFDNWKIYYCPLLRYDLTCLLKEAKDQKTKSIELMEFPTDELELRSVLAHFIRNKTLQGAIDKRYLSLDDVKNSDLPIKSYYLDSDPIQKEDFPIEYSLKYPTYIYFKPSDYEAFFPIEKVILNSVEETLIKEIKVNEEVFYSEYIVLHTKDGKRIKIGKGIEIDFKLKKINFETSGCLTERIRDITFLLAMIQKDRITIGEAEFCIIEEKIEEAIEKIYLAQASLLKIKELLDLLEIEEELDFNKITQDGNENLKTLIKAFIHKEPVSLESQEKLLLGNMEVGNLRIYLLCEIDKNNNYRLINYFGKTDLVKCFVDHKGVNKPVSPYIMMKKDEVLTYSNISFKNIYKSIISIPEDEYYFSGVNLFILELIDAYDESGKIEIYEMALKIMEWMINKQPESDNVYLINKFQILKRRREFSIEELERLLQLKNEEKDLMMLTAICILMDNLSEAKLNYLKLDEEMKERFKKFPIYRLWEKNESLNC